MLKVRKVHVFYQIKYGYKGISSPEKGCNNTRKRNDLFPHVFDIANQLLTRHSPFVQLGQVDEWTAKPSPFSIHGYFSEFSLTMAFKTLKSPNRLQTVMFKLQKNAGWILKLKFQMMHSIYLCSTGCLNFPITDGQVYLLLASQRPSMVCRWCH